MTLLQDSARAEMLCVATLYSCLLPRTMVLGCCFCFEWYAFHITQKYDCKKLLQRERLEVTSVSVKDLIQWISKQREVACFLLFCVITFHSCDLCTFASSRRQKTAYLALFSHTAYVESLQYLAYSGDFLLWLPQFYFAQFCWMSYDPKDMEYLAILISFLRKAAILLFLQFVGISSEISMKGKKSCIWKGKQC